MRVVAYKTKRLRGKFDLVTLITSTIKTIPDNAVIVISSKIVAISEGSVVSKAVDREELIKQQADKWLDPSRSVYGHHFTIKHSTLIGSAGIDSSNGGDSYILLPKDPQATANKLRVSLAGYYAKPVGVVLTDSASVPLRRGAIGTALAYSGFKTLKSYIGDTDLFGDTFQHSVSNRAQAIAVAATLVMGEGAEQTPLALVSDVPQLVCTASNPTKAELEEAYPNLEDDLFEPFWKAVGWK